MLPTIGVLCGLIITALIFAQLPYGQNENVKEGLVTTSQIDQIQNSEDNTILEHSTFSHGVGLIDDIHSGILDLNLAHVHAESQVYQ
jgi:hypothetical protein